MIPSIIDIAIVTGLKPLHNPTILNLTLRVACSPRRQQLPSPRAIVLPLILPLSITSL
jgi:hypothetical protein